MKITVLLSTYNGEKYLRQLLDSLLSQSLKPTKILVRDDGSTDRTIQILQEYQKKTKRLEYYVGDNIKPAKSFFDLINNCEKADYYALCDQDDVWQTSKIYSAIEMLEKEDKNIPLLYCSRYTLTDKDLNPIDSNVSSLYQYTDFAHALLYQTAPGCTFVFNDKARQKIIRYNINKEYEIIHDSIIHKVVALYGKVILDNNSHIYYRQHGDNEIGLTADKYKTFFGRIKRFVNGKMKNSRCLMANSLLNVYGGDCDEDKKKLIKIVAHYRKNLKLKYLLMNSECFRVEGINYFFFKVLVLFNYI